MDLVEELERVVTQAQDLGTDDFFDDDVKVLLLSGASYLNRALLLSMFPERIELEEC